MRRAAAILGLALAVSLPAGGAAWAAPGYDEAKDVYDDLGKSADGMEKANKDCVKAGKSATTGVLAWQKSRDLGIDKDKWWKKAKLNSLQSTEMALLYNTSYLRFEKAIVAGGKQCYSDPRFKKALDQFQGKGKDGG